MLRAFWHLICYNSTGIVDTVVIWMQIGANQKLHLTAND